MKANQKFLKLNRDDAVSPVIAVILMVAITVVLAATVYVWVSGFSGSSGQAARSIALSSAGSISNENKTLSVASATPGLKWNDITLTLDGAALSYANLTEANDSTYGQWCLWNPSGWCYATAPTSVISAGAMIYVQDDSLSGATLRVLDSQANSVMYTLTIG